MIYLFGGGGHAKVIADIILSNNGQIGGVFDKIMDKQVLQWATEEYPGNFNIVTDELILSIGNNLTRKAWAMEIFANYATAIHPSAIVSKYVEIGEGTVVMAGTIINPDTVIGKHCIVNTSASIDHDCVLENYVHLSPNATLCGSVKVGEATHIGAGATIIQGINIGKNCIIGAGATIIRDVPDGSKVVGNPGRIL